MHSVLGWHWSDESVSQSTKTSPAAAASQAKRHKRRQEIHCKETESDKRKRERGTPTHNRTPACLRAKGATSTSFPTLCLLLFHCQCRSHRALLICVTFSCARLEFATLVTRFTRRMQPNPLLSTIYHLPASAVSPRALFEESKSVSDSLSFFLSFLFLAIIFAVGRHHRSRELIHQPRLALLIVDSLQKCATSCSHRRPLWCLQIAHCVGSIDHILDTYRDRTQPGTKMCRSSAQHAPCTCKNFNTLCVGCRRGDLPEVFGIGKLV